MYIFEWIWMENAAPKQIWIVKIKEKNGKMNSKRQHEPVTDTTNNKNKQTNEWTSYVRNEEKMDSGKLFKTKNTHTHTSLHRMWKKDIKISIYCKMCRWRLIIHIVRISRTHTSGTWIEKCMWHEPSIYEDHARNAITWYYEAACTRVLIMTTWKTIKMIMIMMMMNINWRLQIYWWACTMYIVHHAQCSLLRTVTTPYGV